MSIHLLLRRDLLRGLLLTGAALASVDSARAGSMLSPSDFTSLGTFRGDSFYQINTTDLTFQRADGQLLYQGVLCDGMAVFAFDEFVLETGAYIQAFGDRPLVLLSTSDIRISGSISSRAHASMDHTGDGGIGMGSGGGGGHGGAGGQGGPVWLDDGVELPGGSGGIAHGDVWNQLIGGSAGGESIGGGGGGTLELGALGRILVNGFISVDGDEGIIAGGGGAGGTIRLHADSIELADAPGTLTARGGAGAPAYYVNRGGYYYGGGGGGGGQIALMARQILASTSSIDVSGGDGYENGQPGRILFRSITSTPEPSSLLLGTLAAPPLWLIRKFLRG